MTHSEVHQKPAEQTTVPGPTYDRTALSTGIVHFGLGNFHRAHQAMFLDRLMREGKALDWAICGVGVMPVDQKMRDVLRQQDELYTLVLKHPDGTLEPRVIGSIREYLYAPDDPEAVLAKLADPATRIVELTVTEGGYNIDRVTGDFDLTAPAIVHDLEDSAVPTTVFGLVVEGLRLRRDAGVTPFTVMSCDNIQGNGHVARQTFGAFARAKDPALAEWIDAHVHFPNSMVDRITPVTTDADRVLVAERFGIDDEWPVMAEPFVQWVLEDSFTLGRPPYEDVGVQVVDDVMPYELMKLRLLNASHQALTYFGYLSGHRYAHEAATDPLIVELLKRYMDEEATPTLSPVPGIDLTAYKAELLVRFANPEIRDTLARLCQDSSDRIPKWLLPVVEWNLANEGQVTLSAAVVASWARYAEGVDEEGEPISVVDGLADTLVPLAQTYEENHLGFIENERVFGSLASEERFARAYLATQEALHDAGAQAALRETLAR
ncbi:MAG: mannitol dehydrogenase [Frondihabitans sp.]|nr:mannitol dehydrogenase [Frondihabitans sp.]